MAVVAPMPTASAAAASTKTLLAYLQDCHACAMTVGIGAPVPRVRRARLFGCLDLLPPGLELVEGRLVDRTALRLEEAFHGLETAAELRVGLPQRRLRFDAHLPREVGDREQEVAHFFFGARAAL